MYSAVRYTVSFLRKVAITRISVYCNEDNMNKTVQNRTLQLLAFEAVLPVKTP